MIGLLLARELTLSLRRSGFHVLVTAQAVFGLAIVLVAEAVVRQLTPKTPPSLGTTAANAAAQQQSGLLASSVDTTLLLGWALWLILACALAVPALAGGAIARERERGTLAVVLGSGASPGALVAAKLVGVVLLMAGLVAGGLPALALALVFGSPPLGSVAATALIVLAWGGLMSGVGLAASSLTRSAAAGFAAALVASVALLAVTVAAPAVAAVAGVALPDVAYRLNPLAAILLAEPETGLRIVELISATPWARPLAAESDASVPAWLPFVAASLAASALLAVATSLIVGRSTSDA